VIGGASVTRVPIRPRDHEPRHCCEAAARLAAFNEAQAAWLKRGAINEVRINQAKLLLLERYMAERNGSPAAHRDRVTGEDGQPCVYGQFLAGYHRLHTLHMETFPPQLNPPGKPKPPSAPTPTAGEIFEENLPPEIRLPTR
jgi:hypothetical protein